MMLGLLHCSRSAKHIWEAFLYWCYFQTSRELLASSGSLPIFIVYKNGLGKLPFLAWVCNRRQRAYFSYRSCWELRCHKIREAVSHLSGRFLKLWCIAPKARALTVSTRSRMTPRKMLHTLNSSLKPLSPHQDLNPAPHKLKPTASTLLPNLPWIWGFPKIRVTFLRVPIRRTIVYLSLYWGPRIWGNYHVNM